MRLDGVELISPGEIRVPVAGEDGVKEAEIPRDFGGRRLVGSGSEDEATAGIPLRPQPV